jgi:uncharacterized repeat protein (TIGR02543 family)
MSGLSIFSTSVATAADGDLGSLDFGSTQTLYLETTTAASAFAFGTGDFTIEYWWKPTANRRSDVMDFWSDPGAGSAQTTRFMLGTFGGAPLVYVDDKVQGSGAKISGSSNLTLNTWHHIAVTRSSSAIKMWINGSQAGSTYSSSLDMGNVGMKLSIMKDHGAGANGSGKFAGARVVLGSAIYSSTFTRPTSAPGYVSGTSFLLNAFQGAANYLRDSSEKNLIFTSANLPLSSSDTPFSPGAITLAPDLSSISAATGSTLGGRTVRVTGTNLTATSQVSFGGVAGTSLVVESSTSVLVTTPAGTVGAKNVFLSTASGATTLVDGFSYVSTPSPTITSLSISDGTTAGGTSTVISGTNLSSATSVTIDGNEAIIVSNSSTAISITTPAGTEGAKNVVITTAGGSATTVGAFTYFSKFSVTYAGGVGTTGTAPTQVSLAPNETFTVASGASISKIGYTFSKWKDEGNVEYLPGSIFTVSNAAVTLTAIFDIDSHTITFNANGGSGGAIVNVNYGENAIGSAPTVTRSQYTFAGWAESITATSIGTWTVIGAKTLYGLWTPKIYTITYNAESGTAVTAQETFTVGSAPIQLQGSTRAGYKFNGWYTNKTGGTLIGVSGASYTPSDTVTAHAQWTQASLVGLTSPTSFGTIIATNGNDGGISATRSGTKAEVDYFADSLPDGTVVTAYLQGSTVYAASQLTGVSNLLLSVVVAWKAPDESVPLVDPTKNAIRLKITNPDIKRGAKVYSIMGDTSTVLTTAMQDGYVVIELREDPEIVIANPVEVPAPPAPAPPAPTSPSITAAPVVDNSVAEKEAKLKLEEEAKKAAELKAAQEQAAKDLQAAREKAEAEIKAAQDAADSAAKLKAEADARLAAELKAKEDAEIAAKLASQKIVPDVTLYSISSTLKLSTYDAAYLKKYVATLKPKTTITCIGYIYTKNTTLAKAKAKATSQATAVCKLIKSQRKTITTKVVIYPSAKAPKAALSAKWVAVSYRVDGFKS